VESESSGQPVKVAIVDDAPVYRRILRSTLAKQPGLKIVAEADDGRIAVDIVEKHQPDVVLMDFSMPELDGIEATRLIKSKHPSVMVIILTMIESETLAVAARQAGACRFLTKSSILSEIMQAILDCVASRAPSALR
jgi:DNA-binding NarL/FixJ family response regulator